MIHMFYDEHFQTNVLTKQGVCQLMSSEHLLLWPPLECGSFSCFLCFSYENEPVKLCTIPFEFPMFQRGPLCLRKQTYSCFRV